MPKGLLIAIEKVRSIQQPHADRMIDHNATIIARALGGEAPEKGLNGKLSDFH